MLNFINIELLRSVPTELIEAYLKALRAKAVHQFELDQVILLEKKIHSLLRPTATQAYCHSLFRGI